MPSWEGKVECESVCTLWEVGSRPQTQMWRRAGGSRPEGRDWSWGGRIAGGFYPPPRHVLFSNSFALLAFPILSNRWFVQIIIYVFISQVRVLGSTNNLWTVTYPWADCSSLGTARTQAVWAQKCRESFPWTHTIELTTLECKFTSGLRFLIQQTLVLMDMKWLTF